MAGQYYSTKGADITRDLEDSIWKVMEQERNRAILSDCSSGVSILKPSYYTDSENNETYFQDVTGSGDIAKECEKILHPLSRDEILTTLQELKKMAVLVPDYNNNIVDCLRKNHDIIDLLIPITKKIKDEFGGNAQLSLETSEDYEGRKKHPVLYVRQQKYDNDILKIIEKIIWDEYDLELASRQGWILVTTDFFPPR